MDLRLRGRAKKAITAFVDGEVTEEDLASLQVERGVQAPAVKKLRDRHHALARMLAEGVEEGACAIALRYDISRISILKSDPAFRELVAHYRRLVDAEFIGMQQKLASLGMDAADILQERMEENPDEISTPQLMQLMSIAADRTGHGPTSKTEVNVKVGIAGRLAKARERSALARDITPKWQEGEE